jgi:hypothetical protein
VSQYISPRSKRGRALASKLALVEGALKELFGDDLSDYEVTKWWLEKWIGEPVGDQRKRSNRLDWPVNKEVCISLRPKRRSGAKR